MKKIWFIALIAFIIGLASCSDSDDNEPTYYTVTFDTGGGTPIPPTQRVEVGSMATAPTPNPTKTGYAFLFWHLNGANTAYNFQTPISNNITLQAKWQEEAVAEYWQVTWQLNGGSWPSTGDNHATQVIKGGTLAEPTPPTKEKATFDGWYEESALITKINFPYDVKNVAGNFTLYAKWKTEETPSPGNNHTISNATEWNAAIAAVNAGGNNKTYTFTITKSFELSGTSTTIFTKELSGITVTIKGEGNTAPEISLAGNSTGHLIYFYPHETQKIILEKIIFKGHATNITPLMRVDLKGELVIGSGALITGNTNTKDYGGGIHVGGKLIMDGGEISGNIAGVSNKNSGRGAGIYMTDLSDVIMNSGSISKNISYGLGGGVYVGFSATFDMKNGSIYGNTAKALNSGARGGGIYNSYGKFRMAGGTVAGYNKEHGNDIDVEEHYTNDPAIRDACNVVVITATAMGSYGAAFYNNGGTNSYGTFEGDNFTETGTLGSKRERDINVIDGVLQQ